MGRTARKTPLHIDQVQVQILVPPFPSPRLPRATYILPTPPLQPPSIAAIPPPSPLLLDDIHLKLTLPPEQSLLHSHTPLTPSDQQTLSSYLQTKIPLPSLRRLSTHLANALTATPPPPPRLQRLLEQRAHLVADATIFRAQRSTAPHSQSSPSPSSVSPSPVHPITPSASRLHHLKTHRVALLHALARFDQRIPSYSASDPHAADMLIPARAHLRAKLRQVSALLVAYGQSLFSPSQSITQQHDIQPKLPPPPFVPQPPDYILLHSDSDTDDSDLAAAVRLPSHLFHLASLRRRDYYSSDSDIGPARDSASDDDASPSIANVLRANYVINLDESSSTPSWALLGSSCLAAPEQGGVTRHEMIAAHPGDARATFSTFGNRGLERLPLSDEEDGCSGDLDDLERSAERRRIRGRDHIRAMAPVREFRTDFADDSGRILF